MGLLLLLLLLLLRLHLEDVDNGVVVVVVVVTSLGLDLLKDQPADLWQLLDNGELSGGQLGRVYGGDGERLQAGRNHRTGRCS